MAAAGLKPEYEVKQTKTSLQNRRNFLRISGEQRRKRGKRELPRFPQKFRQKFAKIKPVPRANKNKRLRSALRTWKVINSLVRELGLS